MTPESPRADSAPDSTEDKLRPRQRLFALEYLKDFCGKQAAIRAGYSAKGAEVTASKLLRVPKVAAFIAKRQGKIERKLDVSAERTMRELSLLAYVDPAKFYDESGNLRLIHDIEEDSRRALAGLETFEEFEGAGAQRTKAGDVRKVRWHDKRAALEVLAKIQGLMRDKVEVSGPGGGPLEIVVRDLAAEYAAAKAKEE